MTGADSPHSIRKLLRNPENRCSGLPSSERGASPFHPSVHKPHAGGPGVPNAAAALGWFGLGALSSACAALFVNHNGLLRNCFQIEQVELARRQGSVALRRAQLFRAVGLDAANKIHISGG